jgi:hypothetical protein
MPGELKGVTHSHAELYSTALTTTDFFDGSGQRKLTRATLSFVEDEPYISVASGIAVGAQFECDALECMHTFVLTLSGAGFTNHVGYTLCDENGVEPIDDD